MKERELAVAVVAAVHFLYCDDGMAAVHVHRERARPKRVWHQNCACVCAIEFPSRIRSVYVLKKYTSVLRKFFVYVYRLGPGFSLKAI